MAIELRYLTPADQFIMRNKVPLTNWHRGLGSTMKLSAEKFGQLLCCCRSGHIIQTCGVAGADAVLVVLVLVESRY